MDVLLQKSFHDGLRVCIVPEEDFLSSTLLLLDVLSDLSIDGIVEETEICLDVKTADGIRYPSKAIKFSVNTGDMLDMDKVINDIKRINENIVVHIR